MFKIGEFSRLTQVSIRMLRYYDETGLLNPAEIALALNQWDDKFIDSLLDNKHLEIEICAPVALMGKDTSGFTYRNTEPVPIMACTMVYGTFENIAGAYLGFAG